MSKSYTVYIDNEGGYEIEPCDKFDGFRCTVYEDGTMDFYIEAESMDEAVKKAKAEYSKLNHS